MKKVFVSGCYDILHAGHLQFFKDAKELGDHLIVCFASDKVLFKHKKRKSSIPQDHKMALLKSVCLIDEVCVGEHAEKGLDFLEHFLSKKPSILAVTEDDLYSDLKKDLCKKHNVEYVVLPKKNPNFSPTSTSSIVKTIRAPHALPLRVDFAGGWLDLPKFSKSGEFIVNCSISPLVSLHDWDYEIKAGLGGSAAWAMLNGENGVESELNIGCGWQDPAVIEEKGLCVWRSGKTPILEYKTNPDFLNERMALLYTKIQHDTPANANIKRDFDMISRAARVAYDACLQKNILRLADAINMSYEVQIKEGMSDLQDFTGAIAKKYCGGGWGGYAIYLFENKQKREFFLNSNKNTKIIEPYL
jgi:cytidyltransferase-like protein